MEEPGIGIFIFCTIVIIAVIISYSALQKYKSIKKVEKELKNKQKI